MVLETAKDILEIESALEGGQRKKQLSTFKRPLSVSKSGKAFTSKSKLDCHERFQTGDKPFSCSKCNKTFTQAGSLKTHEMIHTEEKPFSC